MRELQGFELDGVSGGGGVEGEFSMEVKVDKTGPSARAGLTIRFGGSESRPNADVRQPPSSGGGGDEPAFTATAMRP